MRRWSTSCQTQRPFVLSFLVLLSLILAIFFLFEEKFPSIKRLITSVGSSSTGAASAVASITFPQRQLPPRALCILSIFKNEALNLREWVQHYKWVGVTSILLLDNGSTDDWREQVKGYEDFVTVLTAPNVFAQERNYNELGTEWLRARGCEFVGVIDLDEFVFSTLTHSLQDAIVTAFDEAGDDVSQLSVNWLMFGSSGHIKHPTGTIRLNFTQRAAAPHSLMKSFIRLSSLYHFKVHEHMVSGRTNACPPTIHLNHYAIGSWTYFKTVKMTRGDVADNKWNNVRDEAYFKAYDFNEVDDELLKNMVLEGGG